MKEQILLVSLSNNYLDRDENFDNLLMSFSCLIGSIIIFNSFGAIDEAAIENFASMVNLTSEIANRNLENGQHIETSFPNLFWLLRDFSLDLGSETSQDYMDNILAKIDPTKFDSQEQRDKAMKKNRLRDSITTFFEKRNCFTLPRPVNDEKELRKLDKLEDDSILRDNFVQEIQTFTKLLLLNVNPKQLGVGLMTGSILKSYLYDLTNIFNEGDLPVVKSLSERYFAYEVKTAMDDILEEADEFLENKKKQLPTREMDLFKSFNTHLNVISRKFSNRIENFTTSETYSEANRNFTEKLRERYSDLEDINQEKSINAAQALLNDFVDKFQPPTFNNKESFDEDFLKTFKEKVEKFVEYFIKEAKGALGFKRGLEFLPDFMIRNFEDIFNKLKSSYDDEFSSLKEDADMAKKTEERLNKIFHDQER